VITKVAITRQKPRDRALRPEQGILGLRKELNLFANLRPAVLYDELIGSSPLKPEKVRGLDILFVRQLNGDIKVVDELAADDAIFSCDVGLTGLIGFSSGYHAIMEAPGPLTSQTTMQSAPA
jgi:isocitrate/isopropylmalate dehydrogenase